MYSREKGGQWQYTHIDLDLVTHQPSLMEEIPEPIPKDIPAGAADLMNGNHGTLVIWTKYDRQHEGTLDLIDELRVWVRCSMQSCLLGACVLKTDRPDTAGYDQVPACLASGENTWKSLLPRAGRYRPCSVSSCDAGARPASSAEDGSQKPPCDPNLTRPKRLGDHRCSSVRRASGLVQARFSSVDSHSEKLIADHPHRAGADNNGPT